MASRTNGVLLFPSGVGLPGIKLQGISKSEGIKTFQALIDLIPAGESTSPSAGFELKIIQAVFEMFHTTGTDAREFFKYNLNENPHISVVALDFLEDTLGLMDPNLVTKDVKERRLLSAKMFAEIMAMPLEESQHVTKHNKATMKRRSKHPLPISSVAELLGNWTSLEGGAYDLLWTARALFGHAQ